MSLKEDFIGKILRSKVGCPRNFLLKSQNIHMDKEKIAKKIQKNPGTPQVPGLKIFFRVKIVVNKPKWLKSRESRA